MDGENFMETPIKMDDLGVFPIFLVQHPYLPTIKNQPHVGKHIPVPMDPSWDIHVILSFWIFQI